jgi:hypothetical protein
MEDKKEFRYAIDGINGITYIGKVVKDTRKKIVLEDYILVQTDKLLGCLKSEEDTYVKEAKEEYELNLEKNIQRIPFNRRNIQTVHKLDEIEKVCGEKEKMNKKFSREPSWGEAD